MPRIMSNSLPLKAARRRLQWPKLRKDHPPEGFSPQHSLNMLLACRDSRSACGSCFVGRALESVPQFWILNPSSMEVERFSRLRQTPTELVFLDRVAQAELLTLLC